MSLGVNPNDQRVNKLCDKFENFSLLSDKYKATKVALEESIKKINKYTEELIQVEQTHSEPCQLTKKERNVITLLKENLNIELNNFKNLSEYLRQQSK